MKHLLYSDLSTLKNISIEKFEEILRSKTISFARVSTSLWVIDISKFAYIRQYLSAYEGFFYDVFDDALKEYLSDNSCVFITTLDKDNYYYQLPIKTHEYIMLDGDD